VICIVRLPYLDKLAEPDRHKGDIVAQFSFTILSGVILRDGNGSGLAVVSPRTSGQLYHRYAFGTTEVPVNVPANTSLVAGNDRSRVIIAIQTDAAYMY